MATERSASGKRTYVNGSIKDPKNAAPRNPSTGKSTWKSPIGARRNPNGESVNIKKHGNGKPYTYTLRKNGKDISKGFTSRSAATRHGVKKGYKVYGGAGG